jgi:hypothetical protein
MGQLQAKLLGMSATKLFFQFPRVTSLIGSSAGNAV